MQLLKITQFLHMKLLCIFRSYLINLSSILVVATHVLAKPKYNVIQNRIRPKVSKQNKVKKKYGKANQKD
jgi:hypothetical protein